MSDAFYPGGVYFKGIEMDKKSDGNKRIDIKFEKKNKLFLKKTPIFFANPPRRFGRRLLVRSVRLLTGPEKGEDRFGNDRALEVALWGAMGGSGSGKGDSPSSCGEWGPALSSPRTSADGTFDLGGVASAFPSGLGCIRLEVIRTQTNWLVVKLIAVRHQEMPRY